MRWSYRIARLRELACLARGGHQWIPDDWSVVDYCGRCGYWTFL